jgi:NAD kinase
MNTRRTSASASARTRSYDHIAFVASPIAEAQDALQWLAAQYGNVAADTADMIVALGGDGLMLQSLHGFTQAYLRHAPRHRRISHERVP